MAAIARSAATLRVVGDALVPKQITELLGSIPTTCHRKGDVKQTYRFRPVSRWRTNPGRSRRH